MANTRNQDFPYWEQTIHLMQKIQNAYTFFQYFLPLTFMVVYWVQCSPSPFLYVYFYTHLI